MRRRHLWSFLLFALLLVADESLGAWHVDAAKRRIFSRPSPLWDAGSSGVYISCEHGMPSVQIEVRDPVATSAEVRLQFDGHPRGVTSFVGKDGVIKNYRFSRGVDRLVAVANPHDSAEIVRELLNGHVRLGYIVDTVDGFDSLEVRVVGFATAWSGLRCPGSEKLKSAPRVSPPPGTFKVSAVASYPATTEHDAFTERDSYYIPYSSSCANRYRLERIAESTDYRDQRKVESSFRGTGELTHIQITIAKLVAGRVAEPSIILSAGEERADLSLSKFIDLQEWPKQNYKIRAIVTPRNLPIAKFWTHIELRCGE